MTTPDVFLSYSHDDRATAQRFALALEADGLEVWWDNAIRSGDAFDEKIEQALRQAKAVVVLWSKSSVASRWVRAEATLADRNGALVPVMIEACERPIMFELAHTVDLSHWTGDAQDQAWQDVLADVERLAAVLAKPVAPIVKAAPKPLEPILAVLAFENLSADTELAFFSDGIAEEILSVVARAPGIKVIGSTSSFSFRGERKKDAAHALGASHVLDGSVRRGGAQVRISATLTEAQSGLVLWTDRFDRDLADAFAVQDEIAGLTAAALKSKLTPAAPKAQVDPQAYDLYLRALSVRRSPDAAAQLKAITYLQAAIAIEPTFARAVATLSFALCFKITQATLPAAAPDDFSNAVANVRQMATRALALEPDDIEAQLALMSLEPVISNWLEQDARLAAARISAPNDTHLLYRRGVWLGGTGRLSECFQLLAQGYDSDPLSPAWMLRKATERLMVQGDVPTARALLDKVDMAASPGRLARGLRILFDYGAAALRTNSRPTPTQPESGAATQPAPKGFAAVFAAVASDPTPEKLSTFVSMVRGELETSVFVTANNVVGLVLVGQVDAALDYLEEAMALHPAEKLWSVWNANNYSGSGVDTLFWPQTAAIRQSPRFLPLCARLGLCAYWTASGNWPDFIVDADNRAELETQVRALATV